MNTLHYIYSIVAAIFMGISVAGAQSHLTFDETGHSFGTIREDGGKVSYSFHYSNTGSEPIVILSATTTCGCTVAAYDRKPIMAGQKGEISITFDPMDRPGAFSKEIRVFTSEKTDPIKLSVSGDVIARQKSIDELYPVFVGDGLRLDENFLAFSYVEHGKTTRSTIKYVNTSDKSLRLRLEPEKSSGLLNLEYPAAIPPGARGEITVTYAPSAASRVYGTLHDLLRVYVNDRKSDTLISATGISVDNRDRQDDKYVPKAELTKNIVKFGAVKYGEGESSGSFGITNTGNAPLNIRAIEISEPEIEVTVHGGEKIAAGKTLTAGVRLKHPTDHYGPFIGRVRIITDDPFRPMREIKVTAIIGD